METPEDTPKDILDTNAPGCPSVGIIHVIGKDKSGSMGCEWSSVLRKMIATGTLPQEMNNIVILWITDSVEKLA